jgi:hypothetical protein
MESLLVANIFGTVGAATIESDFEQSSLLTKGGRVWVTIKRIEFSYRQRGLKKNSVASPRLSHWVTDALLQLDEMARAAADTKKLSFESVIRPESCLVSLHKFSLAYECKILELVVEQGWISGEPDTPADPASSK